MQTNDIELSEGLFEKYIQENNVKDSIKLFKQISGCEFEFEVGRVPVHTTTYHEPVRCSRCHKDKGLLGEYLAFFIQTTDNHMLRIAKLTCKNCS